MHRAPDVARKFSGPRVGFAAVSNAHAHSAPSHSVTETARPPRYFLQGSSGQKKLFNTWFRDEVGASPSWLFVAPTDKTPNRKAIVKVACIPVGKHARHKFAQCHADLALKYAKIYLAIEKLAENCGLTGAWASGQGAPRGARPYAGGHVEGVSG